MKVLKYFLENKKLVLYSFVVIVIIGMSLHIYKLQNKVATLSKEKNDFKDKIELLDLEIDSIKQEIIVKEQVIKEKEVKINKLQGKIIVIHEKYEQKYRDIDNFNNAQLINELSIIFSKNNIN